MLPNERARVISPRLQRLANLRIASYAKRIPKSHRDVPQPAFMPDAPDRAAFGAAQELFFAPREERHEVRAGEPFPLVEIGQGALACELVPGADELAVVAAVDAVADQCAQIDRD